MSVKETGVPAWVGLQLGGQRPWTGPLASGFWGPPEGPLGEDYTLGDCDFRSFRTPFVLLMKCVRS